MKTLTIAIPVNPAIEFGYEPKTTFWKDFSIADKFGLGAIRDTYERGMDFAKTGYVYLTEFVMVLNHKIWEHYDRHDEDKSRLYDELWRKADQYAMDTLKGEELDYYFRTLD